MQYYFSKDFIIKSVICLAVISANNLTTWRNLLRKPIVSQHVKIFPAFYGMISFVFFSRQSTTCPNQGQIMPDYIFVSRLLRSVFITTIFLTRYRQTSLFLRLRISDLNVLLSHSRHVLLKWAVGKTLTLLRVSETLVCTVGIQNGYSEFPWFSSVQIFQPSAGEVSHIFLLQFH